jgi:hypothetical protein
MIYTVFLPNGFGFRLEADETAIDGNFVKFYRDRVFVGGFAAESFWPGDLDVDPVDSEDDDIDPLVAEDEYNDLVN